MPGCAVSPREHSVPTTPQRAICMSYQRVSLWSNYCHRVKFSALVLLPHTGSPNSELRRRLFQRSEELHIRGDLCHRPEKSLVSWMKSTDEIHVRPGSFDCSSWFRDSRNDKRDNRFTVSSSFYTEVPLNYCQEEQLSLHWTQQAGEAAQKIPPPQNMTGVKVRHPVLYPGVKLD